MTFNTFSNRVVARALLFVAFFVGAGIGCTQYMSEFDVPTESQTLLTKPQCNFKAQENCWSQSVARLQSCVRSAKLASFTDDQRVCATDDREIVVNFEAPGGTLFEQKGTQFRGYLAFTYYNQLETCFHFEGTPDDFSITSPAGDMGFRRDGQGNIQVQCLGGEQLTLSAVEIQQGCAQVGENPVAFVPQARLTRDGTGPSEMWNFRFLGTGKVEKSVFRCNLFSAGS